jgi:hypothetical protein
MFEIIEGREVGPTNKVFIFWHCLQNTRNYVLCLGHDCLWSIISA